MIIDDDIKTGKPIPSGVTAYPSINNIIWLAVRFLLYQGIIGACLLAIPDQLHLKPNKEIHSLLITMAYAGGCVLTIWDGYSKFRKNTGKPLSFKFNKIAFVPVIVSIVIVLMMPVLTDPVTVILPMSDYWKKAFADMNDGTLLSMLTVVVAAPILEELFFRGIILNGLLKNYFPQRAIVISAAIFGLVHLNPWQAIPAFLGGLIMGWMYWKTNSIIPGMILHFVNNLFSVLMGLVFKDADTLQQLMSIPAYVALFVACFAISIGGWLFLEKYFEDNPTAEDDDFERELV